MSKRTAHDPTPIDRPFSPPAWGALEVATRAIKKLLANPKNARTHPPEQIAMLRASITEFGFAKGSILVDEGDMLIAGHGMTQAASDAGFEEVPVCIVRGWPDAKKRAFMEADNRLAELGTWDEQRRRAELDEIRKLGFPMEAAGWNAADLDAFLSGWQSTIDPRERFGSNLNEVPGKITVHITERGHTEKAHGIIERALKRAGIEAQLT